MPSSRSWTPVLRGWGLFTALGFSAACDPFHTQFDEHEAPRLYSATRRSVTDEAPEQLRVMTYNIKFGGGRIDFFFDCHGEAVLMDQAIVETHLAALARKIRQVDPDVLLLQEVEINSKRSAYLNQVRWLLETTDLNHAAYASAWRSDFVPSDGLGAVDMGNAVLSKYPIVDAVRIALPLISDQSALERYFYLKRNVLRVRLDVGQDRSLFVLNTHTSAFAKDGTKQKQLDRFQEELERLDDEQEFFVAGGDLNTLPPGSQQTFGFPDSVCTDADFQADDYREETQFLSPFYARFAAAVGLDEYQRDNEPYFTHTTDKSGFWNRKLDYLFTNGILVQGTGVTHQDEASGGLMTMSLSDHAPVSVSVWLR